MMKTIKGGGDRVENTKNYWGIIDGGRMVLDNRSKMEFTEQLKSTLVETKFKPLH